MILLAPTVYINERSVFMQSLRLIQDIPRESIQLSLTILYDYLKMGIWRYLMTCRYMFNDKIENTLQYCKIPTLIVRGEKDKIVPDIWVRMLQRIVSHGVTQEIADAPHTLHYKKAAILAVICRNFFEDKNSQD